MMPAEKLKTTIREAVLSMYSNLNYVLSTTITGSFSKGSGLDGISDIDTIVIVTELTVGIFKTLQDQARNVLAPILSRNGYKLKINTTFGPLKFNDKDTAVLHLMVYDAEAHREHVIKSPFTCFDWQQSKIYQGAKLAEIYPLFSLQPRHFISSRRSAQDYLHDLLSEMISFREIAFPDGKKTEIEKQKQMTLRDKHEYAYHIIRFLMQNLYKLVNRRNIAPDGEKLLKYYFSKFHVNNREILLLFKVLQKMKSTSEFTTGIATLDQQLIEFLTDFEAIFSKEFYSNARRYVFFRHAPTALNIESGENTIFLGSTDNSIMDEPELVPSQLINALAENKITAFLVSSMKRSAETVQLLPEVIYGREPLHILPALNEINYGSFEGKTLRECKESYPSHFEEWRAGKDPEFPKGESTTQVLSRLEKLLSSKILRKENRGVCTHNVVLRCLIGKHLNIPLSSWHKLQVPHMMPIILIRTENFGDFIDINEDIERAIFEDFFSPEALAQ